MIRTKVPSPERQSIYQFLILAGIGGVVLAIVGLSKGSLPGFRPASRKQVAALLAASFLMLMAGVALAQPSGNSRPQPTESPSPEASLSSLAGPRQPVDPTPSEALSPVAPPGRPPANGPETRPATVPPEAQPAVVVRHVDGDTIWAEGGTLPPGASNKIRLLQVDSPESTNRTDCYGREASEFTKAELPIGSKIYLLADKEDKDRYGRFLRYIWKDNGEFFNEKLVRQGYAKAVLYQPNDRYIGLMRAAEAEARTAARGLWSACSRAVALPAPAPQRDPVPAPPVSLPVPPPPQPGAGAGCDSSYPSVCIPPAPPDLDCPQIAPRRFQVLPPDPHGFDSDHDGIGCESG